MSVKVMVEKVKLELEDAGVKIPKKVASCSSSTHKSLSGSTSKAKAMKTAVSVNKSGSGSPNAAQSLDFSGQIVHCDLARKHARVSSLLRRHRQRKSWRRFHLNIERQECSLPSLTSTRLMSLVSTLETLCILLLKTATVSI